MLITKEPLDQNNLHAVAELEKECFGSNAWSENLLAGEIGREDKHYIVVRVDGIVAAYGGFIQVLDEGDVMNIAVSSEYRRMGLATLIIDSFFRRAEELGIRSFTLEVRDSNYAAKKLYEKSGFEFVGKRTKYYSDGEDACIYWKYM